MFNTAPELPWPRPCHQKLCFNFFNINILDRMVQTGSKADGTFSSDVCGEGDICEDRMGGLKRGETIVKRHLAYQGSDVTEKLTKGK